MGHSLSLKELLDLAFVGFVVFTCFQALYNSGGNSRAKRWKSELLALEDALRELVGEASAASGNLDRSLLKRKQELEALLKKIETAKRTAEEPRRMPAERPMRAGRQIIEEDEPTIEEQLPNPSWYQSAPMSRPEPVQKPVRRTARMAEPPAELPPDDIEELLEEDRVTITRSVQRPIARPAAPQVQAPAPAERRTLAQSIELSRAASPNVRGFIGESSDPVTYKIARRLLMTGKEIHIVARKLNMPVAEIRLIDKQLREEMGLEPAPQDDAITGETALV